MNETRRKPTTRERNGRSPTRKCELVMCRASTQVYALVRIIECKKKKKKKKKEEEEEEEKKKYNAHYDKTQMQRKTWERWTQGRPWLVIDNLGVMKCTLCTEHEVTSRNVLATRLRASRSMRNPELTKMLKYF